MNKLRVLTWNIHGNYLYYLTQADVEFFLPKGEGPGYAGRIPGFTWGDNVHDIPMEEVKNLDFDIILFQHRKNYLEDQYEILTEQQRQLPKVYLEHDPPQEHPTNTKHWVDDPQMLLVHVTNFNDLMWDSNRTPTTVIDHGVVLAKEAQYSGELEKGIVVINNIKNRGRRLGLDVFEKVREQVPLDIIGLGAEDVGGIGPISYEDMPEYISKYRFFFNPIRYTSLGLAVCEAMTVGMPIVGLATTEMVTAVKNDETGYIETDIDKLVESMNYLIENPQAAARLGNNARQYAARRFAIERFKNDWERTLRSVADAEPVDMTSGIFHPSIAARK